MTILVVENRSVSGAALAENLKNKGYSFQTADDIDKGLDLFMQHSPRIFVYHSQVDFSPGIDLFSRARQIRIRYYPYCILAAKIQTQDEKKHALEQGLA